MARYAEIEDLESLGIAGDALSGISNEQKEYALDVASSEIEGYLTTRYSPPFSDWPMSLTMHTCKIAVYILMTNRGFNPDAESNVLITEGYDQAIKWARDVAKGIITLNLTSEDEDVDLIDSPTAVFNSDKPRGF